MLYSLINRSNTVIPAILLTGMLFSCQDRKQQESAALKLLHQAVVAQDSNSVLHHLPPCLQLLGDSLVCMQLSATNFTVYNYFTGRIHKRLSVDTADLPLLLAEAQEKINRKYTLMNQQESRAAAVPRTRIEQIFNAQHQGKYFLLFNLSCPLDSPMVINGKSEPFSWIKGIPFMTMLDTDFQTSHQYVLLDYRKADPVFSYGGAPFMGKLILPNYNPERIGEQGFGMLCSIDLSGSSHIVENLNLPFDQEISKLHKLNRLAKTCLTPVDTTAYYFAVKNKILYCQNNIFKEVYNYEQY